MFKNIIYILCSASLIFTLFLLLKSRDIKSKLPSKLFTIITAFTGLWIISLWFADTATKVGNASLGLNYAVFFLSVVSWVFLLFAMNYPVKSKKTFTPILIILGAYNTAFLWLASKGAIVESVSLSRYGASIDQATFFYSLHALQANSFIIAGMIILNIKKRKLEIIERLRINLMTLGVVVALLGNILSGTIAPYVEGYAWLNLVATASTVFFVVTIGYTIIRHKMFDVRSFVARSVTYALLVATLAGLYGLAVFGIAETALNDNSFTQRAIPVIAALLLAFTTPSLRRQFDKLTNRLFYRDAYEPQVFLDELNNVLVANIELDKLLTETTAVMERNLKADYTVFSIRETSYFPRRVIGNSAKKFTDDEIADINRLTPHIKEKVIVTDYLEDEHKELKKVLEKNDVAILIRLVATLDYDVEGVGYILFGAKKSGNPYNKQDVQTLEIIANELVIAIQNGLRFEEIEKFNVTLQEKIDDATRKLQKTNEKLKALDETKDEFISMASHQLRTPLTSVKGYLSMVLEGDAGEVAPMQRKLLDQAFTSSQRMVYLIADLLNVSRLRTGKFVIEPVPTNLAEVVEGEASQLKETAKARGLTLTYDKPENFTKVMLDETKIRQVVMNFMDNAIYYSRPDGTIKVEVKETDKEVIYTVTDDGIGVPKSEQHHLFTKFYRAGNAKKARPDGTGLGLFMAKKVIVAQGGTLLFQSQEGKGSMFGFSFSKSKLQVPETPEKPA